MEAIIIIVLTLIFIKSYFNIILVTLRYSIEISFIIAINLIQLTYNYNERGQREKQIINYNYLLLNFTDNKEIKKIIIKIIHYLFHKGDFKNCKNNNAGSCYFLSDKKIFIIKEQEIKNENEIENEKQEVKNEIKNEEIKNEEINNEEIKNEKQEIKNEKQEVKEQEVKEQEVKIEN